MKKSKPIVLILCGGKSLRLWPLAQYKSKNFLNIFGFSPLNLTIKRFKKIAPAENIFLIANISEKKSLEKIKSIKKSNILFEPESKNTAAAVLLSLLHLKDYPEANIIISPVDHLINREKKFYNSLGTALKEARDGWICTLGIRPHKPSSDFGYIQVKSRTRPKVFSVNKFIEKPVESLAKKLIREGKSFYNSGIFISSVGVLIGEYKKYYPDYSFFLRNFEKKKVSFLYKRIKNIPFDKAIMEKTKKVKMVAVDFPWKDFGNWQTIYEVLSKDKNGNVSKGNPCIYQAQNNLIYLDDSKKKVLILGLKNIFFIDTKGYILLADRGYLNNLKAALGKFKKGQ